mgnify:CR=1
MTVLFLSFLLWNNVQPLLYLLFSGFQIFLQNMAVPADPDGFQNGFAGSSVQFYLFVVDSGEGDILGNDISLFSIINHFDPYFNRAFASTPKFFGKTQMLRAGLPISRVNHIQLRSGKLHPFASIYVLARAVDMPLPGHTFFTK